MTPAMGDRGQGGSCATAGSQSWSFLKSRFSQTLRALFLLQSAAQRQGTWMAGPEAHWGRRGLWGDQSLIKTELVENKSAHRHRWVQDCVCACGSQQWLHTYRTIQTHEWVSIHSCTPLKMSTICSTDFVRVTVYCIPMALAGIICLMEYDSPIFGI